MKTRTRRRMNAGRYRLLAAGRHHPQVVRSMSGGVLTVTLYGGGGSGGPGRGSV